MVINPLPSSPEAIHKDRSAAIGAAAGDNRIQNRQRIVAAGEADRAPGVCIRFRRLWDGSVRDRYIFDDDIRHGGRFDAEDSRGITAADRQLICARTTNGHR